MLRQQVKISLDGFEISASFLYSPADPWVGVQAEINDIKLDISYNNQDKLTKQYIIDEIHTIMENK